MYEINTNSVDVSFVNNSRYDNLINAVQDVRRLERLWPVSIFEIYNNCRKIYKTYNAFIYKYENQAGQVAYSSLGSIINNIDSAYELRGAMPRLMVVLSTRTLPLQKTYKLDWKNGF